MFRYLTRKSTWIAILILLLAFGFRFFVARRLANDEPDDGRVYAQIARNIVEQHVYSHEHEPPFDPSIIRLPGYPLFLAGIYSLFGHGNNTAVRIAQAVIDTATCVLIALVAFHWMPDEKRKRAAAIAALALAAVCPFTAIYSATILTEIPTNFLAVALCLAATLGFKATTRKRAFAFWALAGLAAGTAVLFRPDSGLFAAAVGITIVVTALSPSSMDVSAHSPDNQSQNQVQSLLRRLSRAVYPAAVFSLAFCLVLVPWTIRNRRVFHLFQPLSPAHGEMPGEFVARGYLMWLRSWLDDERYIGPVLWSLDTSPIKIDSFPDRAFDSEQERDRVSALLEKYNHPPDTQASQGSNPPAMVGPQSGSVDKPQPGVSPQASPTDEESAQSDEEDSQDEEEEKDTSESDQEAKVEMTPEIDAGFAQLAHERIARSPVRYYFVLPLRRAGTLWLDTHSQYYPFEGELLPLEDMDYTIHQQYWLPFFAALTLLYSLLGVMGGWLLWRSETFAARRWVILACLIIFLRLAFFSTLENPEPRYTVEIFPFLSILGGVALAQLGGLLTQPKQRSASD